MTQQDRENRFIERCRKEFGVLTFETEMLLRYGFATGASELGKVAFAEGAHSQRATVLSVLGAAAWKENTEHE